MEDRQDSRHASEAEVLTEVILATFRTNGLLLSAGDRLTAPEGLTAARWQVLGAVALAQHPLTAPQIARRMGLTRQSVHATTNRLVSDGLVEFVPNVDHRRSQLVRLTERGTATYQALMERQAVWAERLAEGLGLTYLDTTARTLGALADRLQAELQDQPRDDDDGHAT